MMESILQQIVSEEAWEQFLAHRLRKGRFSWRAFEEADSFVENHKYISVAKELAEGKSLGIPSRIVINKMATGKKRIVYHFDNEKMRVLKLIAHLLYKYDGIFAPNCYAFRQGMQAGDAIKRINRALKGREMWAYKVDIHDYFNSISIPLLLPILSQVLADDPPLFQFFKTLLEDDRAYFGGKIVHEKRGVMAGLPTASFLADVYLNEADHYFYDAGVIYARYSDDIILFAEDRETLELHRSTLLSFFHKYQLTVNPSKEHIYAPGEPFEFLGFRCLGHATDISQVTREKLKGRIRRTARAIRRWAVRENKAPETAIKALINHFNRRLYEADEDSLCWANWFFPVINRTEGLKEIDGYLQQYCRFVATGRHSKSNYRIRYSELKDLGYRSLVHEYYNAFRRSR